MKTLKFICLTIFITLLSCDNNSENPSFDNQQSVASRMYLNSIKELERQSVQNPTSPVQLCFTPSFPVQIVLSNGNKLIINSMSGLKEAIYTENQSLHISAFVLPFTIFKENNVELAVESEEQFLNLLSTCESVNTVDELFNSANCFEFVFPLSVLNNRGNTIVISNSTSLNNFLTSMSENEYWVDFVYPFQINYGGNNITIENIWDFYNYLDCSPQNSCICNLDINPVCVQTPNGIVQFDNACWAQCAGYTQNDFVSCN